MDRWMGDGQTCAGGRGKERRKDGWMDGQMGNGWIDGWGMDGWMGR